MATKSEYLFFFYYILIMKNIFSFTNFTSLDTKGVWCVFFPQSEILFLFGNFYRDFPIFTKYLFTDYKNELLKLLYNLYNTWKRKKPNALYFKIPMLNLKNTRRNIYLRTDVNSLSGWNAVNRKFGNKISNTLRDCLYM